jgi:hypothetical protein
LPASLHERAPVKLLAVKVELLQLLTTAKVGGEGIESGAAVMELLLALTQPFTVRVTVYVPEVTVLGFPLPASLQVKKPPVPLAVIVEFPQLFTTDKVGAAGTANGVAVTELLFALTQPFNV